MEESARFFDEEEKIEESSNRKTKEWNKKNPAVTRQMWSEQEEDEIKSIFKKFFQNRGSPKPNCIMEGTKRSMQQNGLICKRNKETLKKKVFRMIDAFKTSNG